jgi:predicted HicB family RNase H-like nuclease
MIRDYKGYSAKVSVDEEKDILYGQVLGIVDVVTFEGTTVEELVEAFHESVDDYLAYCRERGEEPDKPYSGRFVLRMKPELHRKVAMAAQKNDMSMNDWIVSTVERSCPETPVRPRSRRGVAERREMR